MALFADAIYALPINLVIWAICIGVNLGFLYSYFSKNIIGSVVRRLIGAGATCEENAKTLGELGYKKFSFFHKVILKDTSNIRTMIYALGGKIPEAENEEGVMAKDWENARFYIPESNLQKATSAYGTPQKWFYIPIFVVLSTILSYLMTVIMPIVIDALPLI
ncbi:MAG: hypothetical protein IJC80_06295 [Clostridia bacterium]|nr:hypothetical protein [Clostridia bacterium]